MWDVLYNPPSSPFFHLFPPFLFPGVHPLKPAKGLGIADPGRQMVSVHSEVKYNPLWWVVTAVLKRFTDDDLRIRISKTIKWPECTSCAKFGSQLQGRSKSWGCRTPPTWSKFWGRTPTTPQWLHGCTRVARVGSDRVRKFEGLVINTNLITSYLTPFPSYGWLLVKFWLERGVTHFNTLTGVIPCQDRHKN